MSRPDVIDYALDIIGSYVSNAVKPTTKASAAAKSVKAQRNAEARAQARDAAVASAFAKAELPMWTPPMSFKDWAKENGHGVSVRGAGFVADDSQDIKAAYKQYVNDVFDAPISDPGTIDRILRKQLARERAGQANLGLLGYSADDIVQMAIVAVWASNVQYDLLATGLWDDEHATTQAKLDKDGNPVLDDDGNVKLTRRMCLCTPCWVKRALSDRRSDSQLAIDAEGYGTERFVFNATGNRLRKEAPFASTIKAQSIIEARAFYRKVIATGFVDASTLVPSVGLVYREVKKVVAEGLRQFNYILEGHTPDGVMDTLERDIASNRQDLLNLGQDKLVTKLDRSLARLDVYFAYDNYDEPVVEREAVAQVLASTPLNQQEAYSRAFVKLLSQGMSLVDIDAAFKATAENMAHANGGKHNVPSMGALIRGAKTIVREAQASDDFVIARRRVMEQFMTEDELAYTTSTK